jgi:tRNA(fMet)-specific endonuclease VapC
MNLVLDTSGLIHFFRKQSQAFHAVARAEKILVPVVTLGEWLVGVHAQGTTSLKAQLMNEFLDRPRVILQTIKNDTADYYAHLFYYLKKKGIPVPTNDLWIAACAMQCGAKILTSDTHFLRMPQLLVEFISE